jgi:hypothetical protein
MTRHKDKVANDVVREAMAARGLLDGFADLDEETRHDTTEGETGLFEAIDRALDEIDECAAIVAGCAAQIEMYQARQAKFKARAERIRGLIEQALLVADLPSARLPRATLTVKAVAPKAVVQDEAVIPSRFWKSPAPILDKAAINSAVKDGETIPGVGMDNGGASLQIRRT